MIRKFIFLALITAAALFNACSKDDAPPGNEKKCIVTSLYKKDLKGRAFGQASFSYDTLGRLIGLNSQNDSAYYDFKATYEDAKRTIAFSARHRVSYFTLDSSGRAKKFSQFDGRDVYQFSYIDNNLSILTWQLKHAFTEQISESQYFFHYSNGNLVSIKGPKNSLMEDIRFEYDDKPAVAIPNVADPLCELRMPFVLPGIFGNTSRNRLVKVQANIGTPNGLTTHRTTTYEYETDAEGKTTSVKIVNNVTYPETSYSQPPYGNVIKIEYKCED